MLLLDDTFVVNLGCSEEIWRVTKDNCGESERGKAFVQKEVILKRKYFDRFFVISYMKGRDFAREAIA